MESDGSGLPTSSMNTVKDVGKTDELGKGQDKADLSLEDEFKKITSRTDQAKLKKKYDKLKRIYLKLKQKYIEKEEEKQKETATKSEEPIEIVTIKDEPDDYDSYPPVTFETSNLSVIEKKNLTKIDPKRRQLTKSKFVPPGSCVPTDTLNNVDNEHLIEQSADGKKLKGRRKSSKPRKKEEKVENSEETRSHDDVDSGDYLPLESDPEDDNDETWFEADDCDVNEEDEPVKKKRKKNRSKPLIKVKLKDKIKSKEKKEPQVFRCEVCGKFLSSKPILEKHRRIHTGERPYQCHICGKSFNSLSSFNNHSRIHNGIKPYQCRHCEKCFTETSQRTTHERTHTGEKPYMCDLCGGRFSLRSSLVRHRRIHTGEKPYVCNDCGAAYCQYTQLSHHRKKCGRLPPLPTLTRIQFQTDFEDKTYQSNLEEHKSAGNDVDKSDGDEIEEKIHNEVKSEKIADSSKLDKPASENNLENIPYYSKPESSPNSHVNSETYSSQYAQIIGERDSGFQTSFASFQHFQPYMHAMNHHASNIHAFPSPEVVAREAMERFSSMHPSWFVSNTQSG